jgi:ubiquinone/menaquinone biosynthesis C-methylase UbiE
MRRTAKVGLAAGGAVLAASVWWRKNPSACPYGQRFWVEAPHPFITRARLREALQPQAGETILEVGPGTGYYSLDAAGWVAPGGMLHVFDLQQEMLDHTLRRAGEEGVANISAVRGDAQRLPFEEGRFDAAVLTAVLGEIPDQDAALREIARVLKPRGRLVVGELFGDPHWVSPNALRRRAEATGLRFERRLGPALGCFSVFAKSG